MSSQTEQIKAKLDLVDFIAGYTKITPAGIDNFKAVCPFHNEKTPSLMISRSKQIWKCFGCGAGGDIFDFAMKMEGLDFSQALHMLAGKAGVTLDRQSNPQSNAKTKLMEVCRWAAAFWHKILVDAEQAQPVRDYLLNRGIEETSWEDWQLGYALDKWDSLYQFLIKKGFKAQDLVQAGLVVPKKSGVGYYDRFRHRIIFPIQDVSGQVVGFGGRALDPQEPAKYLNSPQTPIYNKSQVVYGLYQAKNQIKQQDAAIVVEGYMDVIPSHQLGIKNVVAISGTALTAEQLKLLKRYSQNLLLSLDMDQAGQLAAKRSLELALASDCNVNMIVLPAGKDPGECIAQDPAAWTTAIQAAQPAMDYLFQQAMAQADSSTPQGKKQIVNQLLPWIVKIGNGVEKDYWLKRLAQDLAVTESVLRETVSQLTVNRSEVQTETLKKEQPDQQSQLFVKIMAIIQLIPPELPRLIDMIQPVHWTSDSLQNLYKKLIIFYTKNNHVFKDLSVDKSGFDVYTLLTTSFKDDLTKQELKILQDASWLADTDYHALSETDLQVELRQLIKLLQTKYWQSQVANLKQKLQQAEAQQDADQVSRIYEQLSQLLHQKV